MGLALFVTSGAGRLNRKLKRGQAAPHACFHPQRNLYFAPLWVKLGAMKITDVLRAEHAVFHNLFDHIEATVPRLKTLAEVKALATVVE